jgi:hypothetical protein
MPAIRGAAAYAEEEEPAAALAQRDKLIAQALNAF